MPGTPLPNKATESRESGCITGHEIDSTEDGSDEGRLSFSLAEVVEELSVEDAERERDPVDDDVDPERSEHHDPAVSAVRRHRQIAILASVLCHPPSDCQTSSERLDAISPLKAKFYYSS